MKYSTDLRIRGSSYLLVAIGLILEYEYDVPVVRVVFEISGLLHIRTGLGKVETEDDEWWNECTSVYECTTENESPLPARKGSTGF